MPGRIFTPGVQSDLRKQKPSSFLQQLGHAARVTNADFYSHKQSPHTCYQGMNLSYPHQAAGSFVKANAGGLIGRRIGEWKARGNLGRGVASAL